ncbi:thiolase [Suillus americanus]|nr:thiolase [Suillus americanus]
MSSFARKMFSHETVIVAASRTPVGSLYGSLRTLTTPQHGAVALKRAFEQSKVDPAVVEEIYFGNVVQAGVALASGMKSASDATIIEKVCASGMKSIMIAVQSIECGYKNMVAAGGMETMSNAPFLLPCTNPLFCIFATKDSLENDEKYAIWRISFNEHAIESYKRADRAWKEGIFNAEIAPVTVKGKKSDIVLRKMRSIRKSCLRRSPELGAKPLAKVILYADAGVEPIDFPMAPTVALPEALKRANLLVDDIARFEINEAFSVVVRIAEMLLQIDPAKLISAVALGHAIGSSGSRIVVSLVHALKSGEYGAAGICNGGGAASAIVIQKP